MLKFTNTTKTAATFNGASFSLASAEDWGSIGDGPTREAVLAWLAAGNTPRPADPVSNPAIAAIDAQLAEIDRKSIRPAREGDIVFLAGLTAQAIELRAARALLPKMV